MTIFDPSGNFDNTNARKRHLFEALFVAVMFILIMAVACVRGTAVSAADYTTDHYDVTVTGTEDNSYYYTERITVTFESPRHGIYRYIPKDKYYRIRDIKVDGDPYSVTNEYGNAVIKIGSGDEYVSGRKTYTIHYYMQFLDDEYPEADQMYIDVLPTDWSTDIKESNISINMPEGLDMKALYLYNGTYGDNEEYGPGEFASGDTDSGTVETPYGEWKYSGDKRTITFHGTDLPYGAGATVKAIYPEGTWQNPVSYSWMRWIIILLILGALVAISFLRVAFGRDPHVVQTVEFYPPDDITPVEAGYIIDGNVDRNDITAILFYLASKGYISINEYESGKFEFTRLKVPVGEKEYINRFFRALFGKHAFESMEDDGTKKEIKRNTVKMSDTSSRLYNAYNAIPEKVDDEYSGANSLYTEKSKWAQVVANIIYFIVLVLIVFFAYAYEGELQNTILGPIVIGVVLAAFLTLAMNKMVAAYDYRKSRGIFSTARRFICWGFLYVLTMGAFVTAIDVTTDYTPRGHVYLSLILLIGVPLMMLDMKAKTAKNAELYGRVLGFKNFIKTAELDRLNMLVEENPDYFYDVLPYAYVFGLTKKWAKNFEGIGLSQPEWYTSHVGGFDVFDYHAFNHMVNHVSNNVVSHVGMSGSDSGGGGWSSGGGGGGGYSGGGGGGFSGGGGGGGGGGAW